MEASPSQYTRMIPGTSSISSPRFAPQVRNKKRPSHRSSAIDDAQAKKVPIEPVVEPLSHPVIDRVGYELLAADSIVLAVSVGMLAALFPQSVPWACLPIFIALVTLFAFSEGLYRPGGGPYPAGILESLAKSTLFASALICIAELRFLASIGIFSTSLAALALSRATRNWAWTKERHESKARKV